MLKRKAAQRAGPGAARRGLSLVELMVGIAVGLFVVAAAAMLVTTQLGSNRRLLLEMQVQQDLRASADIITRELRRAGHWPAAAQFVWVEAGLPPADNIYDKVKLESLSHIDFSYRRQSGDEGPYGFKQEGNVLKTRLGAGGWQELTDGNTLRITSFSVIPRPAGFQDAPDILVPCSKPCPGPGGGTDCWPKRKLTVRELEVNIEGVAVSDPTVKRRLQSVVRLRNDLVGAPSAACPA